MATPPDPKQAKIDREIKQQESLARASERTTKAHADLERQKDRLIAKGEEEYKIKKLESQQKENEIEQLRIERDLLDQIVKVTKAKIDAGGSHNDQLVEAEDKLNKANNALGGLINNLEDGKEKLDELAAAQEAATDEAEKMVDVIFGLNNIFLKTLKVIDDSKMGLFGFTKKMIKHALKTKKAEIAGASFLKASEALTAGVFALGREMLRLAFAQDEAMSGFMKATGASYEFAAQIPSINADLHSVGISAQDAGKAFGGLYNSFVDFTEIGGAARADISRTVALLQEIGVSADTSGKILDTAMRSLGLHAKAAEKMLLEISSIAKATRQPFTKVAQDFATVAPKLTKYGDQMMKVFEGLEEQSKRTGLEMSKLIGVTEQFDTFEGAGRAVGRLNAILGGPYLNAIDMLNATDEERIEILQRLTEQSGIQFDELNRYEQMNIAKAMGTDVDTARRMFGASTAEFERQQMAQKELANMARESQTLIDQLKFAFQSALVGMRPIIEEFIVPFIHGLGNLNTGSSKFREELGKLYDQVVTFMKVMGTLLIIGGVAMLFTGAGAVAGVPMIMAGAKMLGVGIAAGWAKGKVGDLSATAGQGSQDIIARGRDRNRKFKREYEAGREDIPYVPGLAGGGSGDVGIPVYGTEDLRRFFRAANTRGRLARSHAPKAQIRMNEGGKAETAIVPYGTYIANASDTRQVMTLTEGLMKEVRGLRNDLAATSAEFVFKIGENEMARVTAEAIKNPIVQREMRIV